MIIHKNLCLALLFVFLKACNAENIDHVDGTFYFGGGGNVLASYTIGDKEEVEVDQMGRHNPDNMPTDYKASFFVEYVLDEESFLMTASHPDEMYIYKYNIKSKSVEPLRRGHRPVYMAKHNKIVFYEYDNIKDVSYLFVADINDTSNKSRELISDNYVRAFRSHYETAVPISDDKILYHTYAHDGMNSDSFLSKIMEYDLTTKKSKELSKVKGCYRTGIWRESTKQMLCRVSPDSEGYFLISLDGTNKQFLNFQDREPIHYLPEYDLLVLSDVELGIFKNYAPEMYVIYLYDFGTQKQYKIANDIRLNDFVWYPKLKQ
jgi:hypothetical protein